MTSEKTLIFIFIYMSFQYHNISSILKQVFSCKIYFVLYVNSCIKLTLRFLSYIASSQTIGIIQHYSIMSLVVFDRM
jgi:hypothetical protein